MKIKDFINKSIFDIDIKNRNVFKRNQDYFRSLNLSKKELNYNISTQYLYNNLLDRYSFDEIVERFVNKKYITTRTLLKTHKEPSYWKDLDNDTILLNFAVMEMAFNNIKFNPYNPSPEAIEILESWGIKVHKIAKPKHKEAV